MKTKQNYVFAIIGLFIVALTALTGFKENSGKMAFKQRIVCFKFKDSVSAQAKQQHMDDFMGLKKEIPEILSYSAGKTLAGDFGKLSEYDVMHYATFADEVAIDRYFNHPAHKQFIERNKMSWEKVLVINSNMNE